ncbi:hypothetical protein COT49_01385 [candidate division WWE3 bacterium CG08_land_8_20_14_0_20_40_13]|uniref:LysM domain-containing protein n=1 Tax=candidate division WWE3 bacterium CG08_land_8_20_14_0_20_40_13 TaxID=1975084 RepID=A0A2H0XE82_UNCKA|nr:MAG: hypothetical protein COT49_01385 [candidate division WWE3 bacterium CG08_land_8_20_14_0_20_40_13]
MNKNLSLSSLSNNPLAAIVAGVLVVVMGFSLYSLFSKNPLKLEEGKITNEAAKTVIEEQKPSKVLGTDGAETPKRPVAWFATNYKQGDILGQKYEVKEGDTLWEIAEARYGSGFEWGKILDANSGDIGWLSNGNPLITPGQVLILPD